MKINDLNAGYPKNIIIRDLNLEVEKGEIISIIGPNGGGKSTLLKTISGQIKMFSGSVFLGEDELKNISIRELSKRLSIVTTEKIKPQHMTLRDVVLSGRLPYSDSFGRFSESDYEAADRAEELMKIKEIQDKPYEALSDGQKQRTLLARAICQGTEYLIMDEPTSYLDIRYKLELMEVLRKLSDEGVTIIMSLHEPGLALRISDRILMIDDKGEVSCLEPGEVLKTGVLKGLYGLSDEMYSEVKAELEAGIRNNEEVRHSSYFLNKECEYYPCHDLSEESFSCMFCYCPLYDMKDCGGEYTYTEKGAKNCKNCTFPHVRENYGAVIKKLKEKMYGNN